MSAFAVQSHDDERNLSTFGTKDPVLAATLGNFGFQAKNALPCLLVVSAANVINVLDKNSGRIEGCAHLEFRFESQILDPIFGTLWAKDVSDAFDIAKLAQKEQTKEISPSEAFSLSQMRQKWARRRIIAPDGANHGQTLLWAVQKCYDQVTNFLVVAAVTKELAKNPLIEFSKKLTHGVAYAIEPLNTEASVHRRSEKLFRK